MSDTKHNPEPTAKPKLNIYQRINEVRKEIDYVRKDRDVSTGSGGQSYKAVSHDAVTAIIRPLLVKHGIVIVPRFMEGEFMEGDKPESKQRRYVALYEFDFVNCDEPSDKVTVPMQAHAMDNADKAPGKAVSYAAKYAMLKLFSLETGEDEEGRHAEDKVITEEQVTKLLDLAKEVGADMPAFRKRIRVEKIEDLPAAMYEAAMKLLEAKREKKPALQGITDEELDALCADKIDEDGLITKMGYKSQVKQGHRTADALISFLSAKMILTEQQIKTIKAMGEQNATAS